MPEKLNKFELGYSLKAFGKIPVCEYVSRKTGLTVVIAEVEGPIVTGHFCLATETFDDDGLPHTLEHLIFLGSLHYPYKGVLDLLANRCLASGTNAFTQTDHTCYTMETAGSDGFLALLPIYLEHILYPTLKDEAYVTEVHHITGDGNDAGVVYCEMQGRENSAESRLQTEVLRYIYPGRCGYSSEVGGRMKNLRESTSNEKCRAFHKAFYRPENLKIIICGKVEAQDVFDSLTNLEELILSKGKFDPFERPWQTPIPPVPESKDMVVKYPSDEETNGMFCAAFRGPSLVDDYYTVEAVLILLEYLSTYATSPLNKMFVEIDDPDASAAGTDVGRYSEICLYVILQDVPVDKLPTIGHKLKELFMNIVKEKDIDMIQIRNILEKNKQSNLSELESSAHKLVPTTVIEYMLYGRSIEDLVQRFNPLDIINKMLDEPKSFWLEIFDKYFVSNQQAVFIQCTPSIEVQQQMAKEEKERIERQIETLKPRGLLEKKKLLEEAITHNERPPPQEMLTSVPIPGLESIKFHSIERFNSDSESKEKIDLSNTPVFTYFDNLESNFVFIIVTLDTTGVPSELKKYIRLFLKSLTELPIERDGILISYEDVETQISNDTIGVMSSLGIQGSDDFSAGSYSSIASITMQVEASKYEIGFKWMSDLLYKTVFTPERLNIIVNKINNSVATFKRDATNVVSYIMNGLRFQPDSNIIQTGVLQQYKLLTEVQSKLECGDTEELIGNLEKVRKILSDPSNVVVYVSGNLNLLNNPVRPISEFIPPGTADIVKQYKLSVTPDYDLLKKLKGSNQGCVVGIGSLESSNFFQTAPSIHSKNDPDLAALRVFINYLAQLEGPLWKQIRGKGFAYSYSILCVTCEGLIYLSFDRATNVVGAYKETKAIVDKQLETKVWDEALLESAKSSLMFEIINLEKTLSDVTDVSFRANFDEVDYDFNQKFLKAIKDVTCDDLNRVGEQYMASLFDPKQARTAIVTDPAKLEEIAEGFKELGLLLDVYNSLEDSFLNEL
ncbi:uncharacterized protein C05D11.1-like isoform X1 [Diorhabda carinulata]|uniref:uncharacterized protein C05D11.1-like isoform X1 n=2 Tax=Diorhabda carinulata TaxID=1163345 RepID=UPI0025A04864|nr:uncharacterized protein C05D11.1-like isoform X1 [Diorhabda carinulata]XP_057672407.1 uncharacterized protein C05D11.1-like isoform X1 [Diorhabda carinulata]